MRLLNLEDDIRAYPAPEAMEIEVFRAVRDAAKDRTQAVKWFSYIFHMCDVNSPYFKDDEEIRHEILSKDLFNQENWDVPSVVDAAMDRYVEIHETASIRLLRSSMKSVRNLQKYFEEADPTVRDNNGRVVWKAKDIVSNLSKVGDVIEGISDLQEIVEKEQMRQGDNRAGVKTNRYSS